MKLKRVLRGFGFAIGGLVLLLLLTAGAYFATHYHPAPLRAAEITKEVDILNEEAAVQGPHFIMAKQLSESRISRSSPKWSAAKSYPMPTRSSID